MNNYNLFKQISASNPVYITNTLQLSADSQYPIDSYSGVSFDGFVMHKSIEMYLWKEHKTERKESFNDNEEVRTVTTYSYTKEWTSTNHNSARFKHPQNHYNPQNDEFI